MTTPPHRVLIAEADVASRIEALAREIALDLPGREPIIVGLLRGSFVFLADLSRALTRHDVDPQVELAWASRYPNGRDEAGEVRVVVPITADLRGRSVLLVDDIVDTGDTLRMMRQKLEAQGPAWLRTCVLLDKKDARRAEVEVDYRGFVIPSTWVFGYGLDTEGFGRALPYIATRA